MLTVKFRNKFDVINAIDYGYGLGYDCTEITEYCTEVSDDFPFDDEHAINIWNNIASDNNEEKYNIHYEKDGKTVLRNKYDFPIEGNQWKKFTINSGTEIEIAADNNYVLIERTHPYGISEITIEEK